MTPEQAWQDVRKIFPFEGMMEETRESTFNIVRTLARHLPPGARVLDLGTGPCEKPAVARAFGFACAATDDHQDAWYQIGDNREKIHAFARQAGVEFRTSDGKSVPFEKGAFDCAMMHDVLEHLHDSPREMLNDLLECVKPEGLFFTTVPNAGNVRKRLAVLAGGTNHPPFRHYYWYPGPWRGHVREYVRADLRALAGFLGLEILELRGCHHMTRRRVPGWMRPFYFAATAVFDGLRDSWLLVARKPKGWAPRRTLPPDEAREILGCGTTYRFH